MDLSLPQTGLIILGIILAFFGLPLYSGFLKIIGFVVGAFYGIYLFMIFAGSIITDPLFIILIGAFTVLVFGIIGIFMARLANYVMFFLAGGLVGVLLEKIFAGAYSPILLPMKDWASLANLIKPTATDLIWFIGGGIIFIISVDVLVMLALAILGTEMIWIATRPMKLTNPDWVIPVIIGVVGLMVQEGTRRKYKGRTGKIKVFKRGGKFR